jgi:hypothetical protein
MPPFDNNFEPVALPGEAVRLVPSGEVYEVAAVEQLGRIGPVDYGAASAGSQPTESGSSIIDLTDELELFDSELGQYWVNPLSDVEVEIRQTGQQDQRLVNANQVGVITQRMPPSQRQVFVHGSDDVQAIFTNNDNWDHAKTLVYYTGFKLALGPQLDRGEVQSMAGQPATVPSDTLKQEFGNGQRGVAR